jgi:hypothetical protein
MITQIGGDEIVMIVVPRGSHRMAAVNNLDLQQIALDAVVSRVRASSIASHMARSIQMKFHQTSLLNAD